MQTDRQLSSNILKCQNIWNKNGSIDPFKLNPIFMTYFKDNNFEAAQALINELKNSKFHEKILVRVNTAQSQLNGILGIIETDSYTSTHTKVQLQDFSNKTFDIESFVDIKDLRDGLYKIKSNFHKIDHFNTRFRMTGRETVNQLIDFGFSRAINSSVHNKFRVSKDIRVHGLDSNFYALSNFNNYYDSSNSARLAKITNLNLLKITNNIVIDKALILPFEASVANYYHNISEMVYGIRYAKFLPSDYKIIYTEDRFGALRYIANKMNIDLNRLISIKDIDGAVIRKAISIYPIGYSWNKEIYNFFSKFRINDIEKSYIYISRLGSRRSFINEKEVEESLSMLGFRIIRAEDYTFEEQVKIFSNADFLIAGHGAGLTNMLFMQSESKIIEIFPPTYVKPDFYFRSLHNNFQYEAIIAKNNVVDISSLVELVKGIY